MDHLIHINNCIQKALNYKVLNLNKDKIHINNYEFSKHIVNEDGEFIGEKYKKHFFFKTRTNEYYLYELALSDNSINMGFYISGNYYTEHHIKSTLENLISTGLFKKEAEKLYAYYLKARENLDKQEKITQNLISKLD